VSYRFRPITSEDVDDMAAWRYATPYEEYDPASDGIEEIADAVGGSTWFAVEDDDHAFTGFAELKPGPEGVEIGLGLRPERTGRGEGAAFVLAIVAEVRRRWPGEAIWLDVLPWNERAAVVYERCGFVRGAVYLRRFESGVERGFLRMTLDETRLPPDEPRG
jgi:[ribosomal protein S18]-alanine N-acetyltransferase